MKSSKTLAALVTMGLAAAVATPAMALENQFNGSFTSFYDVSNYSAVGNQDGTNMAAGLAKDAPTANYFVQRVRLGYTAKASEDLKLVTKFELDYDYWGNSSYSVGRGNGGAIGADSVNLETKNLYLDVNLPKNINAKVGMMGNADSFKGALFDSDMAGVLLSHSYTNASVNAGFFRFKDSNGTARTTLGKNTQDMFELDGKYSVSKDLKIGAAYYYIADDTNSDTYDANDVLTPGTVSDLKVHTVGLNAEAAVGPVTLTGFVLKQFGDKDTNTKAKGYTLNIGASMPLAGGTARTEFLYAGGGKNSMYVVPGEGGAFYNNEMTILSRDKNATSIDSAIVFDINNGDQGVFFGSVGYDYTFTPKLSGSVNAGFASITKDVNNVGNKYIGTEVNCEANYKLMPALTVGARAGYVVLGDYFASNLDNPYDVKLLANFSF